MPGLKITWRGGVAYATGSIAGRRVRQSLQTRDRAKAPELCAILEARLWKRHSYGEAAVRTFEEAALSYMTSGGEARYVAPLLAHFRGRVVGGIKPEELRQAARTLGAGKKPSTQNRQYIIPARSIINHAADLGWCSAIRVKALAAARPRRRAVGRDWIDAFVAQADKDGLPHLSAAMLFMWQTGTRVSETARVLPEHLDLSKRLVLLATTKEDQWEVRYLTLELVVRIANLAKEAGAPLFGYASRFGIRSRMRAVCRRAGIQFVPPHQAGRHSFATAALDGGAKVKAVMEAGGWKTARMLIEVYDHVERAGLAIADQFDANRTQPEGALPQVSEKKRGT